MNSLTDLQKGYIAGLVDGEGSILLAHQIKGMTTPNLRIRITQKNPEVLYWIMRTTGIGKISENTKVVGFAGKPHSMFHWHISAGQAENFLRIIGDLLIVKRVHCDLAIACRDIMNSKLKKGHAYTPEQRQEINAILERFPRPRPWRKNRPVVIDRVIRETIVASSLDSHALA